VNFENVPNLSNDDIRRIVFSLLNEDKAHELEHGLQVDFSFGLAGIGRFRANAFCQRSSLALALRVVPARTTSPTASCSWWGRPVPASRPRWRR
jgi:twitching motility protein PilT